MNKLEACWAFTIEEEGGNRKDGGFVNDSRDPGGATKYGISLRAHREDIGDRDHDGDIDADDVRLLTREDALALFKATYFDVCRADELPAPLALMVVDFAYNSGPRRACQKLQERLGVNPDGKIGAHTLAVANSLSSSLLLSVIEAYGNARRAYVRSLPAYASFGNGWENRIDSVVAQARSLVEAA